MWAGSFTTVHLFMLINALGFSTKELEVRETTSETPDTVYRSRCTRRFTPGVCEESAASVWTFCFYLQNCTERLGCPISYRANRFPSYRQCMRRCRPLIDIYIQILAIDNYTGILYLRNQPSITGRREGNANISELNEVQSDEEGEYGEEDDEGSSSEEPLFNLYYRDDGDMGVSLPPDIDYVVRQDHDEPSDYVYED